MPTHKLLPITLSLILLAGGCAYPEGIAPTRPGDARRAVSAPLPEVLELPAPRGEELPELGEGASLADYLTYAALNSPDLRAAFQRWKAAVEQAPQVSALPDPMLTYGYFIHEIETRAGPQEQRIGLMQKFPWFGKLRLKGQAASEAARAAWATFQARKLHLFHKTKSAYADYYYLSRSIGVTRDTYELVQYLEEVARTRYKTGALAHGAVVKAQVEMGKLEDRLESLRELRKPRAARLNAVLGRAATAPVPWPEELPQPLIDTPEQQLLTLLQRQSPQLEALRAQVARHKNQVKLAQKDFYPDFAVGLTYMDTSPALMPGAPDSSTDPVLATLSLNLPIWRTKYRAGLRQARWSLQAARRQLDQQDYDLQSELKLALYEYNDSRRKIDLFAQALVPKAEESLRANQTAFQAGEADFLSLLDAERRLLEFRLAEERARADLLKAAAKVEMLVGPLSEPSDGRAGQGEAGAPGRRHTEGETS